LSTEYSNLGGDILPFAENLSVLQAKHGETNYRLAKEIGVHQSSIANWKSGVTPHPRHIRIVAEHFGVTVDELLSEDSSTNEEKEALQ
jgi:transcriptional regulator with XRE-family HTH domain